MERKKWWASLVAVAMGFAFAVGSASAYQQGDLVNSNTEGKLIPYYMTGDNMATIIGVYNQDPTSAPDAPAIPMVNILQVRLYNAMGMEQARGEICLAANEFGYAVVEKKMMMDDMHDHDMEDMHDHDMEDMHDHDMDMMDDSMMYTVLRVGKGTGMGESSEATIMGMPGEDDMTTGVMNRAGSSVMTMPGEEGSMIADMGYVVINDLGTFTAMPATPAPDPASDTDDGCDSQGNPAANTDATFAAWAIIQDVGEGSFFGTEIPTATVAVAAPDFTADPVVRGDLGCDPATGCEGLVATTATGTDTMVTARFDNDMMNDSMSMVYVWLDNHTTFEGGTGMRTKREVNAMVYCEGMAGKSMMLDLPDRINMINGMDLGCEARGVVMITLPDSGTDDDDPNVAAVWSHIMQDGGGFRMNFLGYAAGD